MTGGRVQVAVHAGWFAQGQLPPVCALSGRAADTTMSVKASPPTPWFWAVFGLIPLVAAMSSQLVIPGEVPVHHDTFDVLHAARRRWRVVLAVTTVAGAGGLWLLAQAHDLAAGLALALAVALPLASLPVRRRARQLITDPTIDPTDPSRVWLEVHPAFAEALAAG